MREKSKKGMKNRENEKEKEKRKRKDRKRGKEAGGNSRGRCAILYGDRVKQSKLFAVEPRRNERT